MNILQRARSHVVSYLWNDNPGFILVATAMLIMHVILAVDSAKPEVAKIPLYEVLRDMFGVGLFIPVLVHWLCVAFLLAGLLTRRLFTCVRIAGALSAAVFNMYAIAFLIPCIQYHQDLFMPLAMFALSLNSIYMLKAPKKLLTVEDLVTKITTGKALSDASGQHGH